MVSISASHAEDTSSSLVEGIEFILQLLLIAASFSHVASILAIAIAFCQSYRFIDEMIEFQIRLIQTIAAARYEAFNVHVALQK